MEKELALFLVIMRMHPFIFLRPAVGSPDQQVFVILPLSGLSGYMLRYFYLLFAQIAA